MVCPPRAETMPGDVKGLQSKTPCPSGQGVCVQEIFGRRKTGIARFRLESSAATRLAEIVAGEVLLEGLVEQSGNDEGQQSVGQHVGAVVDQREDRGAGDDAEADELGGLQDPVDKESNLAIFTQVSELDLCRFCIISQSCESLSFSMTCRRTCSKSVSITSAMTTTTSRIMFQIFSITVISLTPA